MSEALEAAELDAEAQALEDMTLVDEHSGAATASVSAPARKRPATDAPPLPSLSNLKLFEDEEDEEPVVAKRIKTEAEYILEK